MGEVLFNPHPLPSGRGDKKEASRGHPEPRQGQQPLHPATEGLGTGCWGLVRGGGALPARELGGVPQCFPSFMLPLALGEGGWGVGTGPAGAFDARDK
jgi:hypothetical protein